MPAKGKGEDDALRWVEIADFTPGLITNSGYTNSISGNVIGSVPGQKVGQAQQAIGCIALPNGGLAPGPGLVTPAWSNTQQIPPAHNIVAGHAGDMNMIIGLFSLGRQFFDTVTGQPGVLADEIIIGQNAYDASNNEWTFYLDSLQTATTSGVGYVYNNILTRGPIAGSSSFPLGFRTMTGGTTRVQNNSPYLMAGNATWFLEHYYPYGGGGGGPVVINYPDPGSVSSFTPHNVSVDSMSVSGVAGQVVCHQNRMILLVWNFQGWSSSNWGLLTNEAFFYSDPPNSPAILGQDEVFVQEDPTGYGAWGSISASELFLVKNGGGGLVISGDLNSPTVTRLPGVTPTHGLQSRAGSTPIGLVYAANHRGLWAWNGSNTSQKISEQLEDDFFTVLNLPPVLLGPTVDICPWGDWIIVSNDYLYDTNTGGWFQLAVAGATRPHLYYQLSGDGSQLYASVPNPTNVYALDVYSRQYSSTFFVWESYPIRLPADSKNRPLDIREVVIRASGVGTVTVTLTGTGGTTSTASPSATINVTSGKPPAMSRVTMGLAAQDVTVKLISTGANASTTAPVIYSVAIGYVETPAKVSAG
jgi:hypothetical protein